LSADPTEREVRGEQGREGEAREGCRHLVSHRESGEDEKARREEGD
jgi:hypothetical protein